MIHGLRRFQKHYDAEDELKVRSFIVQLDSATIIVAKVSLYQGALLLSDAFITVDTFGRKERKYDKYVALSYACVTGERASKVSTERI